MVYKENVLSYEKYCLLRKSVGWLYFSEEQIGRALDNSPYNVVAVDGCKTVGMGRVVGDGLYYTIVDIVVHPDYQKKGIGSKMIDMILAYIDEEIPEGGRCSVQLIAEKGKEGFYMRKGFKLIPHDFCGPGMRKVIHKIN